MSIESLISKIKNDKMNSICFDCGAENPVFVSVNNGIFLCDQCATVHMSFPQGISNIENNDLNELPIEDLQFLASGGNTRLNDFILDEFPKLENYSQKLLYKTRGMDYYRKRLNYFVNGGSEPRKPSQIVGCQLIPDNYYTRNTYTKNTSNRFEPKTKTYKPEEHVKSRKFNINQKNNENDLNDEEFFRDPFMNEKFGDEGKMFKKFFGKDSLGFDDDFFNMGGKKLNQTQIFNQKPTHNFTIKTPQNYNQRPSQQYTQKQYYPEKQKEENREHRNIYGPQDNMSRSTKSNVYQSNTQQRPLTAKNPIFVPSRKHKYIKKEEQNNNNNNENVQQTNNYQSTQRPRNYQNYQNNQTAQTTHNIQNTQKPNTQNTQNTQSTQSTQNNQSSQNIRNFQNTRKVGTTNNNINNNEKDKYNPFKRRDSTELITLPIVDNNNNNNNNSIQNKRKQKPQEIPIEFHKQANGLGQIADTINENEELSLSESFEKSENEKSVDSTEELERIAKNSNLDKYRTNQNPKDIYDENQITFKNSIRNKYKKRKSEQIMDNLKNEDKLRNARPNNKNNIYESKFSKKSSNSKKENNDNNKKHYEFKNKNSNDDEDPRFNKKYARRLSKLKISSTNWNINQLGDINTYPDALEIEK